MSARRPIDLLDDFAHHSRTYLCDVCGKDILHMKVSFNLVVESPKKRSYTNAPREESEWDFDVCFDCMETIRGLGKERQHPLGFLPNSVLLVAAHRPGELERLLEGYMAIQRH